MSLMIKIFGVVLIVSGSIIMGWVPSNRQRKRLERLIQMKEYLDLFYTELKHERRSIETYFLERDHFMDDDANKWLSDEERNMIFDAVEKIKTDSYNDALNRCGAVVEQLSGMIDHLKKTEEKNGKARPLVTGALGLLLAVLLF